MSALVRPLRGVPLWMKILLPLGGMLTGLLVIIVLGLVTGILQTVVAWVIGVLVANIGVVRFVVAATLILLITVPTAFLIIFMEMKVIAFMNLRIGPNRVGPWGTLASVVHGLKVLVKEDYTPLGVDSIVFTLAPAVTYLATVMGLLVIPFAPGLIGQDMNIAVLYFFAVGGLTVVGLLMAGWSSFNKYSLLGGLRSAAQMISYEIPLTLSVVGVVMLAGTMSLNGIVQAQSGSILDWFFIRQPLAFAIFFIAATAEGNRTPFDLTEADSEIVAGAFTEYSGMRFGFFFFAEYVSVFVLSALIVTLFFGGWTAPFDWPIPLHWAFNLTNVNWLEVVAGLIVIPPIIIALLALPIWFLRSSLRYWQALLVAFGIFNLIVVAAILLYLVVNLQAVVGLLWFLAKSYVFVFTFVWMRATLPRIRVDQLMGLAWKWMLPAALVNLFVTALAILVINP